MAIDLTSLPRPARDDSTVGTMARGLVGSEILKIAAQIRELVAKGQKVCNLTVGDFAPKEFPIPDGLRQNIATALQAGETNYPPSDGVLDLRQSVQRFYERALGLKYPLEGIVIAGGARPIIYGTYRAVLDEGDTVVYPVPSWNNNHYAYMLGAKSVVVTTDAAHGFMPTVEQLAPHLPSARLLCLCSPLNPTGTMISPDALAAICERVVAENREREKRGQKPLILMYDQIYWVLSFGGVKHVTPVELVPEVAKYTVFVDGISKAFASTGVRVGWGVGPPTIIARMRDVLGHVGAWAPKAEQVAVARYLDDTQATESFLQVMRQRVDERLEALHRGFTRMREAGLPVQHIAPQGAIYLSVRFDLVGKGGLKTNDDIRKLLLEKASFAVVPFQAFGLSEDTGWFRLSVGATSVKEIEEALPRVEAALREALAAAK
ncbi:aminotransferase class I/II-fold pyridoxal phosphate-dependent enzyme [Pyxidicoccus fallax]|uniref:Aminotransferase class I/II-fold pyridoxal phosphate-dependent enzyme n=1 Tax=Pyxidicoccus fallax TaxID=394095 RepID=A0A848LPT2_9BACT|nr:aminotransferase class I/II-fold pyridoxal phosphate-dependent enzyme [Pyxidicoccus fallax]NMO19701.1 aminotransferase class I/II-fold pyridoxal phosphate-dependent enzyme [Pyxidicoccus fallax]NPC81260.1 aminotransferase class I/II-fold pyridoxal phosphate-dependent enzyme [Pyxidicoccus fallax]